MTSPLLDVQPITFPWQPLDPFLFCAHHLDHYPAAADDLGPADTLEGRNIGQDFSGKDGWSMYHGSRVPGFPRHPHRGFETITLARQGVVDHADSLGATARFGQGDVQWMTAGQGIEHSEMFPLRDPNGDNTLEIFQIWLNLPRASKTATPYFTMMWADQVQIHTFEDAEGRRVRVTTAAGALDGVEPPAPPPDSWASRPENEVAVWMIELDAGAAWTIPAAGSGLTRSLFFFDGASAVVAGHRMDTHARLTVASDAPITLVSDAQTPTQFVLLQGRPLGEPVVQHGPFVMSTVGEIKQTILDYQRGAFGRWPWPTATPDHGREQGRFAKHPDGRIDTPPAR